MGAMLRMWRSETNTKHRFKAKRVNKKEILTQCLRGSFSRRLKKEGKLGLVKIKKQFKLLEILSKMMPQVH